MARNNKTIRIEDDLHGRAKSTAPLVGITLEDAYEEALEVWLEVAREALHLREAGADISAKALVSRLIQDKLIPIPEQTHGTSGQKNTPSGEAVDDDNKSKVKCEGLHVQGVDEQWVKGFLRILHSETYGESIQKNVIGFNAGQDAQEAVLELRKKLAEAKGERESHPHAFTGNLTATLQNLARRSSGALRNAQKPRRPSRGTGTDGTGVRGGKK